MKNSKIHLPVIFVGLAFTALPVWGYTQSPSTEDPPPKKIEIDGMKLAATEAEVPVNATLDEAWKVLTQKYIDVDEVFLGIVESGGLDGLPETGNGAARYCDINFKKREIKVKEKIVNWQEADQQKEYMYDVYEFKNFPMKKMYNVWGVKESNGQVLIYNKVYYKMKPGIMTGLMRGQMKKLAVNGVLSYKHYLETGEGNVASKELLEKYKHL